MPLPTPHKTIWSVIPVFLMIGIIFRHPTLDIQRHDTYFIISAFHLSIFFSIILSIIGFIYWQNKHKKLTPWMTFIHVVWTLIVMFLIQIFLAFGSGGLYMYQGYIGSWSFILFMLTLVVQILLLINVRRSRVR